MTLAEAKELYLATKNTGLTNAVGFPTVIFRRFRKPKKLFLPALLAKSIMSTHSILKEKMIMKIFLCCGVIRKNWPEAAALAIWVHICWI